MSMPMTDHLSVGALLQGGRYRVVRFLSAGGFGCTYVAEHKLLNDQKLCIKELYMQDFCVRDATGCVNVVTNHRRALVDKLKKKFLDEASALFRYNHGGIVKVHDIFEENGTAYFTMDYIDGMTLRQLVEKFGPLSEADALDYIRQAADALAYVHSFNRLHLDIKPDNIMVDADGNVKLIDFGVSKQYDEVDGQNTSTLMGQTVGYAPLEQMSQKVTQFYPATDIYSLGATLYYILSGNQPPSSVDLVVGVEHLEELPSTVSKPTRDAVAAAMRQQCENRPQTIAEWLKILDDRELAKDQRVSVQSEQRHKVEEQKAEAKPKKHKQWPWVVAAITTVFVIIMFIVMLGQEDDEEYYYYDDTEYEDYMKYDDEYYYYE